MSAESDHIQQQVTWLAQWMTKSNDTLTNFMPISRTIPYGGEALTEGEFVNVSEQLAGLISTQRQMDDCISNYAAANSIEVSPGMMVLDETGSHYVPGDDPQQAQPK